MKRLWYCRNGSIVVFVLATTEEDARAAAFAAWNDDPDEVRDVTDPFALFIGPLITLLRERVPAKDGSGMLFRFKDPLRAIRYWLGDDSVDPCPECGKARDRATAP